MLNMFWMLLHPSSGACDLFVESFHGLYSSGSMCVGVTLWFGCGGVVSVCRPKPAYVLCSQTPICHRIGLGSVPIQFIRRSQWQWDSFASRYVGFAPVPVIARSKA